MPQFTTVESLVGTVAAFPNRCAWAPPPGVANDPDARTVSAEAVTLGLLRFGLRGLYVLPGGVDSTR